MIAPQVKTPACEAGVIGAAKSKGIDGQNRSAHGRSRGLRAYEAAKAKLLTLEMLPAEYAEACRAAAQRAGV